MASRPASRFSSAFSRAEWRAPGAFIAEVDGNLTAGKSDNVATLHWQGKFRGPDFAPVPLQLATEMSKAIKDRKGRTIPTIIAKPMSERERNDTEAATRSDGDPCMTQKWPLMRHFLRAGVDRPLFWFGWLVDFGKRSRHCLNPLSFCFAKHCLK
jgi:hypothetical protein